MTINTWKTLPVHHVLLKILEKKRAMKDEDLFDELHDEFKDIGFKDFNKYLMNLEISGKIRTTSISRGKKRVELVE
ncbi:MAG: hypothetical protein ACOC6H_03175 [Thermoproteota archaeon]